MITHIINDEVWGYLTGEHSARAAILPSGKAYLLPIRFLVSNSRKANTLTASYRVKNSEGIESVKSKNFSTEKDFHDVINSLLSDDKTTNGCIAFRNYGHNSGICFLDVAVHINRYRKPFDSLSDLLAYLASVYPAHTLPEWASKRIASGEHLNT